MRCPTRANLIGVLSADAGRPNAHSDAVRQDSFKFAASELTFACANARSGTGPNRDFARLLSARLIVSKETKVGGEEALVPVNAFIGLCACIVWFHV